MLNFSSDYLQGAHPRILENLIKTNMEETAGYGLDPYCEAARQKIRNACKCPQADVHFLVGGTQTNATVIKAVLRPYEGVIAAESGHIALHEAGAIEASGHKVLTLPHQNGKITAHDLAYFMDKFNKDENNVHMVKPGMVYISHPSEYGSLYNRQELQDLHDICRKYKLPLFLDGARLGYGLAAYKADVTLEVIAQLCDVFYIGGTKVGALFGEAVVIPKQGLFDHFFTLIKQQGALLAKGRLLGIQFDTLFTDNLYITISKHAIDMSEKMKKGFIEKKYRFFYETPTNQQFIILENKKMAEWADKIVCSFWEAYDDHHTVVRFATNWATQESDIDQLLAII